MPATVQAAITAVDLRMNRGRGPDLPNRARKPDGSGRTLLDGRKPAAHPRHGRPQLPHQRAAVAPTREAAASQRG